MNDFEFWAAGQIGECVFINLTAAEPVGPTAAGWQDAFVLHSLQPRVHFRSTVLDLTR